MSLVPNLLLGIIVVKGVALMALALGTWLVCRDHGAERWAAAVVSVALPVSGYTLYWDAGSWAAGLLAFAYAPWVWWSFRRVLRGAAEPVLGVPGRQPRGHPGQPLRHPRRGRHRPGAARRGRGGPQLARRPHPPAARRSAWPPGCRWSTSRCSRPPSSRSGPAATCSPTTARCARPWATCSCSGRRRTCRRSGPSPARCRCRPSTSSGSWCRCCRGSGTRVLRRRRAA